MKWLQISDLHFGYDGYNAEQLRHNLIEFVKQVGQINIFSFEQLQARPSSNIKSTLPSSSLQSWKSRHCSIWIRWRQAAIWGVVKIWIWEI